MHPLLILLTAVGVLVVFILWLRINAFLSLLAAATTVGTLSPRISLAEVMPKLASSFGAVCAKIGIIIALAAVIGECLLESGAADKITRVFIRLFGEKRSSLSLLTSGYVLGIPVFFDTVFYLLIPLARSMRIRTGRNYLLFVMSIVAGGITAHCMIPPTPGPPAMAAALHIDLGLMILAGAMAAAPMALAGWLFARCLDRTYHVPLRETPGISLVELSEIAREDEPALPPFFRSAAPIFLPVTLIGANTFSAALGAPPGIRNALAFGRLDPGPSRRCGAALLQRGLRCLLDRERLTGGRMDERQRLLGIQTNGRFHRSGDSSDTHSAAGCVGRHWLCGLVLTGDPSAAAINRPRSVAGSCPALVRAASRLVSTPAGAPMRISSFSATIVSALNVAYGLVRPVWWPRSRG